MQTKPFSPCPAVLTFKVCVIVQDRRAACRGRCLHLSTEECQSLCLKLRLIMSVVSLQRPVINLSWEKERERESCKEVGGEDVE